MLEKFDYNERNQSKPRIQEAGEFYTTSIITRSMYGTNLKNTSIQINWHCRSKSQTHNKHLVVIISHNLTYTFVSMENLILYHRH